jgi:hypothetical protein
MVSDLGKCSGKNLDNVLALVKDFCLEILMDKRKVETKAVTTG